MRMILFKFSLIIFFSSLLSTAIAQDDCAVNPGDDITIPVGEGCTTLSADIDVYAYSESLNTNSYIVLQDVCLPDLGEAIPAGIVTDDSWTDIIDIGFDFSFFGEVYSQLLIGDNGIVTFDIEMAGDYCPWVFTDSAPSPNLPKTSIFGAYHDLDTSVAPEPIDVISYYVIGEAPLRMFVINYDEAPHFQCNEITTTQQIILYETSNIIAINIVSKPVCTSWNNGNALLGIQNQDGSVAYVPGAATTPEDVSPDYPERNTGVWDVSQFESWQFVPENIALPDYTFNWLDENDVVVGTDPNGIEVCPDTTTFYTAVLEMDGVVAQESYGVNAQIIFSSTVQVTLETEMLFCGEDDYTLEDVANRLTGEDLTFWTSETEGEILPYSTPIYEGMQIWVSEGASGTEDRNLIEIQIQAIIPAPTGDSPQYLCSASETTLADIAVFNTDEYNVIFWWADPEMTVSIQLDTIIEDGVTYYASQSIEECAEILLITFVILPPIPAPTGDSPQSFCEEDGTTLADAVVFNTDGFDGIYWFDNTNQTGELLDPSILIQNGDIYYAYQGIGDCAQSLEVIFELISSIPAPVGEANQFFDCTATTLSDIIVLNTDGFEGIYWFDSEDETANLLAPDTPLVDETTYYAFQAGCPGCCSESLAVTIYCDTNAVSTYTEDCIQIFPNPFKKWIEINTTNTIDKIIILNTLGEIVYYNAIPSDTTIQIDLSPLNTGVYVIEISESNVINKYKLIKE